MEISQEKIQLIEALILLENNDILKKISTLLKVNKIQKKESTIFSSIKTKEDLFQIIQDCENSPDLTEKEFKKEFYTWKKKKEKLYTKSVS